MIASNFGQHNNPGWYYKDEMIDGHLWHIYISKNADGTFTAGKFLTASDLADHAGDLLEDLGFFDADEIKDVLALLKSSSDQHYAFKILRAVADVNDAPEHARQLAGLGLRVLTTHFQPTPEAVAVQIGPRSEDGLWYRVRQAAFLESDTPDGRPFTGRRFAAGRSTTAAPAATTRCSGSPRRSRRAGTRRKSSASRRWRLARHR